ncbi:hypothetical protein [Oceanobacillus sp. FSL K6-0127]|uniref:DUF7587 domain-containing protein n=1 Tax=Oceanobacillus TaxID=182709 RepID=UPI0030EDC7A7
MKKYHLPGIIALLIFISICSFQFFQPSSIKAEEFSFPMYSDGNLENSYIGSSVTTTGTDIEETYWDTVTDWFDGVGETIDTALENIKEVFDNIVSYISELITTVDNAVGEFTGNDDATDAIDDVNGTIDQAKDTIDDIDIDEDSNGNIVYRVLREDEDPTKGIFAKAPEREHITIAGHVNNGGKKNFKGSKYISTTKSFDIALKNATSNIMDKGSAHDLRIVKIDLSKVTNMYYDLTDPKVQDKYLVNSKGEPWEKVRRYANASQELLVEYEIPAAAIELLGRPSELLE